MRCVVIVDNRIMPASLRFAFRCSLACFALAFACASVAADSGQLPGGLRERFPMSSIDSNEKADAALAATNGAKLRVENEYKASARECLKNFAVNECVGIARTLRHDKLAEIEAVVVEANRFKRRDKADRIEADRARHEADRAANANADADLRARNRKTYDDRSEQAKREAAQSVQTAAARARRPPALHTPLVKVPKPGSAEANAEKRAKNAGEQETKVREAITHREELARRHAQKESERARRAQERARRDAETQAAQKAAGTVAAPKS